MKTIATLILLTILTSCSKNNDDEPQQQANVIDVNVELSLKSTNGEDLLDPNNPNGYKAEDIKLYYLINGEKQEVFDANMDYPRNFFIFKHESEYRIRIFQNLAETEALPITYVEWNNQDTDTLQAEYHRADRLIQVIKTWFNGELKWDVVSNKENFFTIIK
ncbi:hypothetical protein [Aequorivita sp. CIP111184]|uniref:hypothetical protein n=1 Tax=Aequorivita sp. CIP111184 TaxID=2211356 RepID=UPI000DBBF6BC|nr:hypothetical protein [Aequorivita sp. CIP111184]SRX55997.1 hypothetical protein AEQU1_03023 [Aequorivita sp. CIP111184]